MSNRELLYDKLSAEYDKFIADLLVSSPSAIIDAAYQKTVKEDILSCFEFSDSFDEQEISALLSLENPLDELYLNWRDADDSHMDELRESIDSFAKHETDRRIPTVDNIAVEQGVSMAQIDSEPENPQTDPTVNGEIQPSDKAMTTANAERQAMSYPEKRSALMACINDNLRDYRSTLIGFAKLELIEMADKISAMTDAHSYMRERDFADDELDFFLHFKNPLEVVADASLGYRGATEDDIGFALDHVFTHKLDFIKNYPLTSDADISADMELRRFMGVDLVDFLGKIADKVITDLKNDWYSDSFTLWEVADNLDYDNGRFVWTVYPSGTLLNREKDVFIKESDAYKNLTGFQRSDNVIYGYYVEVTEQSGLHLIGNVYEIGDYPGFINHIRDTAISADTVTLTYSDAWGADPRKTVTVGTDEYDRDRYYLVHDKGDDVTNVCYNLSGGAEKLSEILRAEHARRMLIPIGSTESHLVRLSETLNAAKNPPEQAKATDTATKKQSIAARLDEAGAQARAYNAQHTDNSKQYHNRTDKEMI